MVPTVIPSTFSVANRLRRAIWAVLYIAAFRPSPKPLHGWRRFLLRLMGARIASTAAVHASARIWAPWNLIMEDCAALGPYVDCYSVAPVTLGAGCVVSQYSYLCTATHDYTELALPLVSKPIMIGRSAWVCADVFIGPGVTVGEGAVVAARSSVYRDIEPWTVVVGNPARFLKRRTLKDISQS
jgi:putative colanic acid biosynthesis acetyltransferase WcaF